MPQSTNRHKKPKFEHEIKDVKLESVQCVKDRGVTIASSLKFSQQCKDVAGKANRMLGFYKQNLLLQENKIKFYHCISA